MKHIITLLIVLVSLSGKAQITLMKNNFVEKVDDYIIPFCGETDYGINLSINEKITKYDKVVIKLVYRNKGDEEGEFKNYDYYHFNEFFRIYPNSKEFEVRTEGEKYVKILLFSNEDTDLNRFIYESVHCNYSDFEYLVIEKDYRIVVDGYIKTGSESYWDGNVLKERNLHTFSKVIMETPVFNFSSDFGLDEAWDKLATEEQRKDFKEYMDDGVASMKGGGSQSSQSSFSNAHSTNNQDELSDWMNKEAYNFVERYESIRKSNTLPYIGLNTIGSKYILTRNYLLDNWKFKELEKLENTLLKLADDSKKSLKKALKGIDNPEELLKIFMGFKSE